MELTDDLRKQIKSLLTARPSGEDARAPHRQKIGGGPKRKKSGASLWPFKSDALGVNPDQIAEAEKNNRAHGVPVEYDRNTGAAIITGPKQYRDAARAGGVFTGRDGYGAPGVHTGRDYERTRKERREALMKQLIES